MADKFTGTITYNRLRNRETDELSYDNEFDPLQFYYEDELAKQRAKQAAINDFLDQDEEEPKRKKKKKKKKSKKKFFITLLVLLIIAGCAGGAYALFFAGNYQPVSVNLMDYMKEPTFSGEDKSGVLGNLDLDREKVANLTDGIEDETQKTQVQEFFKSVTFSADESRDLANGDMITVTANYSEMMANDANITVYNNKEIYEVKGLEKKKDKDEEKKMPIDVPQWYKKVEEIGDEISVTCILIADKGTALTLPFSRVYCQKGGTGSEMVDTDGDPDYVYNGKGYYLEEGYEPAKGTISEMDKEHIKYSLKLYGETFDFNISYVINENGLLNVTSSNGGDINIPTGTYNKITSSEAKAFGGK